MNMFARFFNDTETEVMSVIAAIKNDAPVVLADIHKALDWIAGQTPAIVADLQMATRLAIAVGAVSSPEMLAAVAAANEAVVALNAFAAAKQAGTADAAAVVQGYIAVKKANAAVASASAAAAK